MSSNIQPFDTLPTAFLRMCRRTRGRQKVADSTGMRLTGGSLLLRTLVFRRLLQREVLGADERFVGLLLPPSVPGLLANAALALSRRVAVNLNYTLSSDVVNHCVRVCGIRHVLTSRRVMRRLSLEVDAELVYLEDLVGKVRLSDKLVAAVEAKLLPLGWLERRLGLNDIRPDDLFTVIFTSGSTGVPKGVMLSHRNVASNALAMHEISQLRDDDVFLGILPLFHAFGFTCTMWGVLTLNIQGAYHYNPLEAAAVGALCRDERVTVMVGTPTLLRMYAKRCEPNQLASVEVVISGAEGLPTAVADAFEERFGVRPYEGYGTTECSPLVAANVPPQRARADDFLTAKEGTVGRPIPQVRVRVLDMESGEELPRNHPGRLQVRGPNVMLGYFEQPEATREVIQDGWYDTGDVAEVDDDGFIRITGRLSRFSKLGGEMVPHVRIEEVLAEVLGGGDELLAAVTSVDDPRKGERIVVLHKPLDRRPEEICQALAKAGLPRLWIPSPDSFCQVDELPLLGIGKLDLQQLKRMAQERFQMAAPGG